MSKRDKVFGKQLYIVLASIGAILILIGLIGAANGHETGTYSVILFDGFAILFLLGVYDKLFPEPGIVNLLIFVLSGIFLFCLINILDAIGRQVDVTNSYYGLLLIIPIVLLSFHEFKVDIKSSLQTSGLILNGGLVFRGFLDQEEFLVKIEDNKGKYLIIRLNGQKIILEKSDNEYVSSIIQINTLAKGCVVHISYDKLKKELTLVFKDATGSVLELIDCSLVK